MKRDTDYLGAMAVLALCVFGIACGSSSSLTEYEKVEAYEIRADDCALELTPVPELLLTTAYAVEVWRAATGCDITIGAYGVPVSLVDPFKCSTSDSMCRGETEVLLPEAGADRWKVIRIDISNDYIKPEQTQTLIHELGHAFNIYHIEGSSTFGNGSHDWTVDKATQDEVCSRITCTF